MQVISRSPPRTVLQRSLLVVVKHVAAFFSGSLGAAYPVDGLLERCYLKRKHGDAIHAILVRYWSYPEKKCVPIGWARFLF